MRLSCLFVAGLAVAFSAGAMAASDTPPPAVQTVVAAVPSCTDNPVPSIAQCPAGAPVLSAGMGADDPAHLTIPLAQTVASTSTLANDPHGAGYSVTAKSIPGTHICLRAIASCGAVKSTP